MTLPRIVTNIARGIAAAATGDDVVTKSQVYEQVKKIFRNVTPNDADETLTVERTDWNEAEEGALDLLLNNPRERLADVEAGAQKNAPRVVKFNAVGSDWSATANAQIAFTAGGSDLADGADIRTADTLRVSKPERTVGHERGRCGHAAGQPG